MDNRPQVGDRDRPQVGDRVSALIPGNWERIGTVVDTDYHPMGIDDAVKIQFDDMPSKRAEWWSCRWVGKVVDWNGKTMKKEEVGNE